MSPRHLLNFKQIHFVGIFAPLRMQSLNGLYPYTATGGKPKYGFVARLERVNEEHMALPNIIEYDFSPNGDGSDIDIGTRYISAQPIPIFGIARDIPQTFRDKNVNIDMYLSGASVMVFGETVTTEAKFPPQPIHKLIPLSVLVHTTVLPPTFTDHFNRLGGIEGVRT